MLSPLRSISEQKSKVVILLVLITFKKKAILNICGFYRDDGLELLSDIDVEDILRNLPVRFSFILLLF